MREFLKEIFTLRTVYIDRGRGRWAVRKRLHPFMRGVLSLIIIFVCTVMYFKSGSVQADEQQGMRNDELGIVKTNSPAQIVKTVKLVEPVQTNVVFPPANQVTAADPKESKPVLIPANKKNNTAENKTVKKREIILPSEANPGTDRIISTPKNNNNGKYRIVVNKSSHILSLLKGNELIKEYPIATGKNTGDKERVGDHRTPTGNFKIVSIENASSWSHDFRDGKGKIAGAYGPWFLRLDAKGWRGIGIHGTHDPDSRGTNATEGCIRLSNEDIAELKEKYAYRNMPVEIREF